MKKYFALNYMVRNHLGGAPSGGTNFGEKCLWGNKLLGNHLGQPFWYNLFRCLKLYVKRTFVELLWGAQFGGAKSVIKYFSSIFFAEPFMGDSCGTVLQVGAAAGAVTAAGAVFG